MPVNYNIAADDKIVYLTTEGESNFAEWREAMLSVLADPSFDSDFGFLSDRSAETGTPDSEFVRAATQFLSQHSEVLAGCRWATVSNQPAVYGMQRMFALLSEKTGVRVMTFKEFDEARAWLLSTRR